jgi:hydroxyethylthiazole kinase-like sugar kinase family protein
MDTINYDNGKSYIMKGIDSKNKKYDIEVLFFNDNSTIFIVAGEYDIIRYKFIN